ncbi:MAG: lycopene cyclase domain-containing protein [Candidatus Omnitrophica bacterium]|nr:lycopene cyclase domain-containing protein [Candidatus Omnitrophota bacterium]
MKEYTLISFISIFLTIFLNKILKTNLFKRSEYYIYLLLIMVGELIVNGAITSEGIVKYNPDFFMNLRIGSIPVEDFLFGFSMVTTTIILWEFFKKKIKLGDIYEKKS